MPDTEPFIACHSEPLLIVLSGPSGVGKDTVIHGINDRLLPIQFVVTATTRAMREGEREGVDYFFVPRDEFERMIAQGELLEYALVYGEYKGIPKQQVREALRSGKDVMLRIDVQGAATIHAMCPEAVLIFLTVKDEDELERRLRMRKSETAEKLKLRIETAKGEMRRVNEFDYVVENEDDQLKDTLDAIEAIIKAEHHRVYPRKVTL
jgi:guanylate kinase